MITILEFTLDKCVFKLLRDLAVEEFFSYEMFNARKEEKLSTDELPTRRLDSPSIFFVLRVAQFKKLEDFLYDELHTMAMEVRESQGSH